MTKWYRSYELKLVLELTERVEKLEAEVARLNTFLGLQNNFNLEVLNILRGNGK